MLQACSVLGLNMFEHVVGEAAVPSSVRIHLKVLVDTPSSNVKKVSVVPLSFQKGNMPF